MANEIASAVDTDLLTSIIPNLVILKAEVNTLLRFVLELMAIDTSDIDFIFLNILHNFLASYSVLLDQILFEKVLNLEFILLRF